MDYVNGWLADLFFGPPRPSRGQRNQRGRHPNAYSGVHHNRAKPEKKRKRKQRQQSKRRNRR